MNITKARMQERIPIIFDTELRNFLKQKIWMSAKWSELPKIKWGWFVEALLKLGFDELTEMEHTQTIQAIVERVLDNRTDKDWNMQKCVQLNVYTRMVLFDKLKKYLEFLNTPVKKANLKPIAFAQFVRALLKLGFDKLKHLPAKHATALVLVTRNRLDTETLDVYKKRLKEAQT